MKKTEAELKEYIKLSLDPIYFVELMFSLIPQPIKPEFFKEVNEYLEKKEYDKIRLAHFQTFLKGKHITWQQWLILLAVKDAVNGVGKRRISVSSGHGIGKANRTDRKSTRLNSSHIQKSRMPSSA